ncbi:peptidylprolyl isomerase [Pontimicrobium sp. MEBiC01747]
MNKALLLIVLCLSTASFAQSRKLKKALDTIATVEQAEAYIEAEKSKKKNKLIIFNEAKHKTRLAKTIIGLPVGATKTVDVEFGKVHYKVIEKTNEPHYRISYVFLDGNTVKLKRIHEVTKDIIKQHKDGIKFEDLAKKYSMDRNAYTGGDSGWFKDGDMPIEVEEQVSDLKNNLGDIYTVRTQEDNGYYVILKTHRIKTIKEVKVLKIIDKA